MDRATDHEVSLRIIYTLAVCAASRGGEGGTDALLLTCNGDISFLIQEDTGIVGRLFTCDAGGGGGGGV